MAVYRHRHISQLSTFLDDRPILWLTLFLLVETLLITPVLSVGIETVAQSVGLSLPRVMPTAAAFAFAMSVYGILALWVRQVTRALFVSVFVLSTFWMNAPIGPQPGGLGGAAPQLWAVQFPLIALVGIYLLRGLQSPRSDEQLWDTLRTHWLKFSSWAQLTFAGFVVWSFIAVPFAAGPRPDIAGLFALFMLQTFSVFILTIHAVRNGLFRLESVAIVFSLTVLGHCIVGLAEFVHRGPFGFTVLGESASNVLGYISLGPLGTYPFGPHLSGFAVDGSMSVFLTLLGPIALVLAIRARGAQRLAWGAIWLIFALVLRLSGWDAGRGAFLVATVALLIGYMWVAYRGCTSSSRFKHPVTDFIGGTWTAVRAATVIGVGILITLLPSSHSGSSTRDITTAASDSSTGATESPDSFSEIGTGIGPKYLSPEQAAGWVDSVSIPLFDLSNLGVRFYQYAAGIDLFFQYPIFGIGGVNFYFVAENFGLHKPFLMHNLYLGILVETGLPGFLLYMTSVVMVIVAGIRLLRRKTAEHVLIIGILAGFVGYFSLMMFQPQYTRIGPMFIFWTFGGALVGTYQSSPG